MDDGAELGLAISLHAVELAETALADRSELARRLAALHRHRTSMQGVETASVDPARRHFPTWTEHTEISGVILATNLAPAGTWAPEVEAPRSRRAVR